MKKFAPLFLTILSLFFFYYVGDRILTVIDGKGENFWLQIIWSTGFGFFLTVFSLVILFGIIQVVRGVYWFWECLFSDE